MTITYHSKDVFSGIVVRPRGEPWQAPKTNRRWVWSREEPSERERKPLDEHAFVLKYCNVHLSQNTCEQCGADLCCSHFQPEMMFVFCMETQNMKKKKNSGAQARVWILGASHNHESHGCFTIQSMRTRRSELAMEALVETTLEEHEVSCRGGEIVPATHFPAAMSCRILVRTRGFVTSYLGPNFVSST